MREGGRHNGSELLKDFRCRVRGNGRHTQPCTRVCHIAIPARRRPALLAGSFLSWSPCRIKRARPTPLPATPTGRPGQARPWGTAAAAAPVHACGRVPTVGSPTHLCHQHLSAADGAAPAHVTCDACAIWVHRARVVRGGEGTKLANEPSRAKGHLECLVQSNEAQQGRSGQALRAPCGRTDGSPTLLPQTAAPSCRWAHSVAAASVSRWGNFRQPGSVSAAPRPKPVFKNIYVNT